MISTRRLLSGGLFIIGTLMVWLALQPEKSPRDQAKVIAKSRPAAASETLSKAHSPLPSTRSRDEANRFAQDWEELLRWIKSDPSPTQQEIRERLNALRIDWTSKDPQALASFIAELFESGVDAETGLNFEVGLHGHLAGWPSLRVFLLDVLALSDPEMAPRIATRILDQTASADEFVTALRSLTRDGMGRASNEQLLTRFQQMLSHDDWQSSRGFAEGLDLARFVGSAEAAQSLAKWEGNPALKRMALDEFAADHPREMLEAIADDAEISGIQRAFSMARADPNDAAQLEIVDRYLRTRELPAAE